MGVQNMAEATWEKSASPAVKSTAGGRLKFLIGGLLILAAVAYLIISGTSAGARYFITVDELVANRDYVGKTVRISGAVIGDTIQYDSQNLIMDFTIAHIPTEYQNLALTLYEAANDPNATRLPVHIVNQPKPDLLQHEAQAILTGKLGEDGVFYASELLLKCPTRFEEAEPGKAIVEPSA
jgi:cytochrome c-type biogenesis protein CcmE